MQITTTRFGEIQISGEKIIQFEEGLPGLEDLHRFALLSTEETEPFHWLQSLDEPDVSLAVVNPYLLFPEYKPLVPETVFEQMGVRETGDVLVLTVAVIPREFKNMTTNLMAPILIDTVGNQGRQVILESNDYSLRHPIFNEVSRLVNEGGGENAGTDPQN